MAGYPTSSKVIALVGMLASARAFADEDAKSLFERGTALFALHKFGAAAEAFEKAFEIRADPAILYNAAQAHRLAGNKSRSLDLYQSLLRLYGVQLANRAEVVEHIRQLTIAIEAERRATNSPPVTPQPRPIEPPTNVPPTAANPNPPAPAPAATPVLVASSEKPPVTKRRWFWPVMGVGIAVVIAGVTVGVVLGTSKTVPPSPTFGVDHGN